MRRSQLAIIFTIFAMLLMVCGCANHPYEKYGNWVLRQNAVPRYFADYDLFYIYPTLLWPSEGEIMNWPEGDLVERVLDYSDFQTNVQFGKKVRVFAPLVHQLGENAYSRFLANPPSKSKAMMKSAMGPAIRDTIEAIEFYLDNYHSKGRPYVMYGQGQGARILYEALKRCDAVKAEDGFVVAYLPGLVGISGEQIKKDFEDRDINLVTGEYDTGVIASWNVPGEEVDYDGGFVINPLIWECTNREAPPEKNVMAILYDPWTTNYTKQRLTIPALCGAVISPEDGLLHEIPNPDIPRPDPAMYVSPPYGLFTGNLIVNAERRVKQYKYKYEWKGKLPPDLPELPHAPPFEDDPTLNPVLQDIIGVPKNK